MKRDKDGRQVFLFTLGVTLFLLIVFLGFLTVDWQGRSLSFGDTAPPFQTQDRPGGRTALEIRLAGQETEVDITYLSRFFDFLCDFGCIPHQ